MQGTNVVNSFLWSYGPGFCANVCEGNLAIANGYISTNWSGNVYGSSETAGRYTLNGTPTGVSWPDSSPPAGNVVEQITDGTSDGPHNYAVERFALPQPQVVTYGLNWQNPTVLFAVPSQQLVGIAYDPVDNALWLGTFFNNSYNISEYSLSGTLLVSLPVSVFSGTALPLPLGYDPSDNTLWVGFGANLLQQYSTTGYCCRTA